MKYLIFVLAFFIASCNCPECDNISEPVRIIFLNSNGENLLSNNSITPTKAMFCDGIELPFGIKNYVVYGSTEKYHIEFANEQLHENCQDQQCCILIEFSSGEIDTLSYRIQENSSRCCTSYSVSEFKYNGIDYLGKTENTIGAYEVIK